MPRLGDTARVRMAGSHVDHTSPIEDQVTAVYQAARRLAQGAGFKPHVHNGPHGPVTGRMGPMVLKRLCKQLFPGYENDAFLTAYNIINQALRRTDAAVCVKHPPPNQNNAEKRELPTWFVADKMPNHLVVVTTGIAKGSADQRPGSAFDEDRFLTKQERKLTEQETGENQRPGEVTVTQMTRDEAFEKSRDKLRQDHANFVRRVREEIETQPVPITIQELRIIINRDDGATWNVTTCRKAVEELVAEGKVVTRKETIDEALVRGGGKLPKATRPALYSPAPGPVPTRTRLPDGITPMKSAQEQWESLRSQLDDDKSAMLEFFRTPGNYNSRTVGRFAEALGISRDRIRKALKALEDDGLVYERRGCWRLTERKRATPVEQPLPSAPEVDTVQTAPIAPGDSDDNLQLVLDLADRLGVELPSGNQGEVDQLRVELSAVNERAERLQKQVNALKQAIATFGDE